MNIKMGSCHANPILLQAKPVSCVLIADIFYYFWRRKLENRHSIKSKHNRAIAKSRIRRGAQMLTNVGYRISS